MEQVQIDSKFADKQGEIMVVELAGHIDQSNSHQLQKMFDNIIQSGCFKVIVNFNKLYYMSSAGWGVFIGEIKRFRDNGGDIKLANMNADIYDVYQMLEFYHILEDYPTVQEAALSFHSENEEINLIDDLTKANQDVRPLKTKSTIDEFEFNENGDETAEEEETSPKKRTEIIDFVPGAGKTVAPKKLEEDKVFKPLMSESTAKLSELPIYEKVKRVVAQNPLIGVWGIRKVLRHEHFGYTRISVYRLWKLLRELDLHTKAKRYRYYRSC